MLLPSQLAEGQEINLYFPDGLIMLFVREYGQLNFVICPPGSCEGTDESATKQIPAEMTPDAADSLYARIAEHPMCTTE